MARCSARMDFTSIRPPIALEQVERVCEYVERRFCIGRIAPIAGQPFDPLALARSVLAFGALAPSLAPCSRLALR
jgi:hypothetical protein